MANTTTGNTKNNSSETKGTDAKKPLDQTQNKADGNVNDSNGVNNGQAPKVDRGDSSVNPAVAGPGAAVAAAADYPHNPDPFGTVAKGKGDSQSGHTMSEAEWDALPEQSSLKTGYSRENRPPATQSH